SRNMTNFWLTRARTQVKFNEAHETWRTGGACKSRSIFNRSTIFCVSSRTSRGGFGSNVSKNNSISKVRRLPLTNCNSGELKPGMVWLAELLSLSKGYSSGLNSTLKLCPVCRIVICALAKPICLTSDLSHSFARCDDAAVQLAHNLVR